jgi:hypothetical protein
MRDDSISAGREQSERGVSGGRAPGSEAESRAEAGRAETRAGWYAPSPVAAPAGPEAWTSADKRMGEELLHVHPGPGAVVMGEDELRERMWVNSPDGRPPSMKDNRDARAIFIVGFVLTTLGVLAVLWIWAGWLPMLVGAMLSILFIGMAAWPAWGAGAERKLDEVKVKHQALEERAADQRGSWGMHPPLQG